MWCVVSAEGGWGWGSGGTIPHAVRTGAKLRLEGSSHVFAGSLLVPRMADVERGEGPESVGSAVAAQQDDADAGEARRAAAQRRCAPVRLHV